MRVQLYKCLIGRDYQVKDHSVHLSYMEITQMFYDAMKACSSIEEIPIGRKIHAQLITSGLDTSAFLRNNLLRWMKEAEDLFEKMPITDSISWTTMMSGYCQNGRPGDSIKTFMLMARDFNYVTDPFPFCCALKACACLGHIKLAVQLHGLVAKLDLFNESCINNAIVDMYIKCGAVSSAEKVFSNIENPSLFCWNSMIYGYSRSHGVQKALSTFSQMPEHDSVSWYTMISVLSQNGFGVQSLSMFVEMCTKGLRPNSMTYGSVLSACANVCDLECGSHLHARILRTEYNIDAFTGGGLVDMYGKCGCLESARHVFDNLMKHSEVSWTSLISGVAQFGREEDALHCLTK